MLMENQKIGVRAEGERRAGESFPPVKVDREEVSDSGELYTGEWARGEDRSQHSQGRG